MMRLFNQFCLVRTRFRTLLEERYRRYMLILGSTQRIVRGSADSCRDSYRVAC